MVYKTLYIEQGDEFKLSFVTNTVYTAQTLNASILKHKNSNVIIEVFDIVCNNFTNEISLNQGKTYLLPTQKFYYSVKNSSNNILIEGNVFVKPHNLEATLNTNNTNITEIKQFLDSTFKAPGKNPVITYANNRVIRVDFSDQSYKTFTYIGNQLSQIDYIKPNSTTRKILSYTSNVLISITETEI